MPDSIRDGTGSAFLLKIDDRNRARVLADVNPEIRSVSEMEQEAYVLTSNYTEAGTDKVIFFMQNDSSTLHVHVWDINVGSDVANCFDLQVVTSGTAAGTNIIATNLNRTSGNLADITAKGNAEVTGLTTTDILDIFVLANQSKSFRLGSSLILGRGDGISIKAANAGEISVSALLYFTKLE